MTVMDTFDSGIEHALAIVGEELKAAEKELSYAAKPTAKFKGANIDQARQRSDTLKKIKKLIVDARQAGYPPKISN